MTPEGAVKAKLKAYLTQHGIYYYMPVPGGYGKPSVDFLCCERGAFVAIETKKPGAKLTPRQEATMREMRAAGALTYMVTLEDGALVWKQLVD